MDWLRSEYAVPFSGWDFSHIADRRVTVRFADKPWSYDDLCIAAMRSATSVLEVDTGDGERFARLLSAAATSIHAMATEGWPPNVPIARRRLGGLGVEVVEAAKGPLPFADSSFDLILNRHGLFEPADYARLLRPGGKVISQQVGSDTNRELVEALRSPAGVNRQQAGSSQSEQRWDPATAAALCTASGLVVEQALEDRHLARFMDTGAIVWYLKAVPWTVQDFSVESHSTQLLELHQLIKRDGHFDTTFHEFLIVAIRPA